MSTQSPGSGPKLVVQEPSQHYIPVFVNPLFEDAAAAPEQNPPEHQDVPNAGPEGPPNGE